MSNHVKGMTSCRPPESEISNENSNESENSLKESENLQPTCNLASSDCISRQAAIDAVSDCGICIQKIVDLPSAQPDIIHCGECKHRDPEDHKCDCGHDILWQLPRDDEWYCADAERKEGE